MGITTLRGSNPTFLYRGILVFVLFATASLIFQRISTMETTIALADNTIKEVPCVCPEVKPEVTIIREESSHKNCPLNLLKSEKEFLDYFRKPEGTCSKWETFGLLRVGGMKYICVDPKFNIKQGACTVLSFGINNEWSFDDDVDKYNCKVYAFDPSLGKPSHQRSPNIYFTNVGVGSLTGTQHVGTPGRYGNFSVDTFQNLVKRIGYEKKTLDYVKMDIDFSELSFFMQVFIESPHVLKYIKQIGMEVHPPIEGGQGLGFKSEFQLFWLAFQMLKCHGFKLYHSRPAGAWFEVVWAQEGTW